MGRKGIISSPFRGGGVVVIRRRRGHAFAKTAAHEDSPKTPILPTLSPNPADGFHGLKNVRKPSAANSMIHFTSRKTKTAESRQQTVRKPCALFAIDTHRVILPF